MIRQAIAVALLAWAGSGCAAKETGPAWPAPSEREDGGESLAPRKAAYIEESREDEPELPEVAPAPAKVQPTVTNAAAPTPAREPKPSTKQAPQPKPIEILAPPPKRRP